MSSRRAAASPGPGACLSPAGARAAGRHLDLAGHRAAFAVLVAAQDKGLGVSESRAVIARRFGPDRGQLAGIVDEGLDGGWLP